MRAFTRLYRELDATTRTSEKLEALRRYFASTPPADAAWGVHVLTGGRVRRAVGSGLLRSWVAAEAELPPWLVDECYSAVGDLAETLALLLPEDTPATDLPLARVMEEWILPLPHLPEAEKERRIRAAWRQMDGPQRLVFHKLIGGGFRVGVARTLVVRALAAVAGAEPAVLAHRLSGGVEPTPEAFERLLRGDRDAEGPGRPYPFFLAHPLEGDPERLGPREEWLVEWKWDGIRAQLLRRDGDVLLWSRGEEAVTPAFPEVAEAARTLPDGVVLDGELLAWDGGPLPFARLQRRLNRRSVGARLRREVPVRFLAYDVLESGGVDLRDRPLKERRGVLEELFGGIRELSGFPEPSSGAVLELPLGLEASPEASLPALALSPPVEATDWSAVVRAREAARERGVEGLMLKRLEGPYRVGRPRGDWWKWKVDPHSVDAVLLYAQRGHGRRAGLYTDYTFGVWDDGELVPVAKAYSGLTDREIREVDRWIRGHTVGRFGPVRAVEPGLVFELAFEAIQRSPRHRAGVALRFPRMARWRRDKDPSGADSLEGLRALLPEVGG